MFQLFFILLQAVRQAPTASAVPTTWWKSDTVRIVFDLFERRKFKSLSKANAEVTPTDVYNYAQPECAEG